MTSNRPKYVLADIKPFVISREFDAPRDLMWKLWTEPKHFQHWFGPKGFKQTYADLDLRPGGTCHYCLEGSDESEMWGLFRYQEIVPPEKLVWLHSFSDSEGGITTHPMAPDWPREMITTVTFTEREGKTTVTIEWIPVNASEAEIAVFEQGRDGMKGGWTGTFEQLDEYIAKL